MEPGHTAKIWELIESISTGRRTAPTEVVLAAYNAVLLEELLFVTNELLLYKRNEVHK